MKLLKNLNFNISKNYYQQPFRQKQDIASSLISEELFDKFHKSLPKIVNNVFSKRTSLNLLGVENHIKKIADHSLHNGNKLCGSLMLYTYKTLATKDNITEQSFYLACVLAWSAELFQCLFNILDTIEDNRYAENVQVKTLHLLPDAKAGANDVCLIISSIYEILNIHFADKSSYNNVINLFNTAFLYKATGRHFDAIVSKATTGNYALFTTEQYDNIVYLYNTYSTLHLPIYLGMTLAAKVNEKYMQDVQDICIDIGRLFQMQVEYQDCFGDGVMDKASNAIGNGKCTWLAVTALQRCTRPQQIVFNSCYGSPEPAHMERIKELYRKLKLPQIYHEQNRAIRKRIAQRIEALSQNDKGETLPPELFTDFLKQTIHDDK